MKRRHFILPDTQVKAGVPLDHFRWLGQAIHDYAPDRIIHLGDHWDLGAVSSHNTKLDQEGARIQRDVEAGNAALSMLEEYSGGYVPPGGKYLHRGNHEHRLDRYIAEHPEVAGIIGEHLYNDTANGWKIVPYVHGTPDVNELDGLSYAHYFTNVNSGRAIGGTAYYKLNSIGTPFVQGHVQGYDIGTKQFATGRTIRGIVVGSCYLHDESYKGNANKHWRGALVLNEVENGSFSEMPLTMDYLCRKYEGMALSRFLQRKYRNAKQRFTLANG